VHWQEILTLLWDLPGKAFTYCGSNRKRHPQQNAIVERFNRTYREDVLNANLFFSLNHAREVTHSWIEEYNDDRPHEALNYKTTNEYVA
jgi:putative transposase